METLWYGLKVALVGLVVVFAGLVILIACIRALKAVAPKEGDGDKRETSTDVPSAPTKSLPPAPEPPVRTYVPGPPLTKRDDTLYAVISAAISATLESEGINPEGGFAIRSVKAIDELGRKLTLKDGELYAVITGAVAQVLESEGVNPDGGFAIRSVKAV